MTDRLTLVDEQAMCLDASLEDGPRTVRTQVTVKFKDVYGQYYYSTRIIKMRLKKETEERCMCGQPWAECEGK
jgi:hypothetical protein